MKHPSKNSVSAKLAKIKWAILSTFLIPLHMLAQEGGLDIDVDIGGGDSAMWYQSPWVWVGVAAFIIILVLVLKRPSKS